MRNRSIGLCIFFSIITCGIYTLYWMVCLTDDSNECTGRGTTTGGMALLFSIITCGIYYYYWCYKMGDKLDQARAERGVPPGNQAILYLMLPIVGLVCGIFSFSISIWALNLVAMALMQSELNRYYYGGNDF